MSIFPQDMGPVEELAFVHAAEEIEVLLRSDLSRYGLGLPGS